MNALPIKAHYMERVYDLPALVADARRDLAGVEFDTLVGRGLSGALVIPRLADALGVKWLLVRKPEDGSHSGKKAEGELGRKWLFVDDLICTGSTLREVHAAVMLVARFGAYCQDGGEYVQVTHWRNEFVGAWLYGEGQSGVSDYRESTSLRRVIGETRYGCATPPRPLPPLSGYTIVQDDCDSRLRDLLASPEPIFAAKYVRRGI
jgi:hypothetical protein